MKIYFEVARGLNRRSALKHLSIMNGNLIIFASDGRGGINTHGAGPNSAVFCSVINLVATLSSSGVVAVASKAVVLAC